MATPTQLLFISDIEIAVKALLSQGVKVTKMLQVTDAAGRHIVEVSSFCQRLVSSGDVASIARLHAAFRSVNLEPACLRRAMLNSAGDNEPEPIEEHEVILALETMIPIDPSPVSVIDSYDLQGKDHLGKVIQLLTPLSRSVQHRVITTACAWFGVGG